MSGILALAIPVGVALGLGLWTLASQLPRVGAARLATRIAPYVRDVSAEARRHVARRPPEPVTFLGVLLGPLGGGVRRALRFALGTDGSVEQRLRQAGSPLSTDAFRGRQLLAAAAGAGAGVLVATLIARTTPGSLLLPAVAVAVGIAGGLLAPERLLSRAARIRRTRIAAELPTVLEFLTLALSAGEGILDAVRRIARVGHGDLAVELARVVAQVNSGVPLADALHRCTDDIALPALTRAVEQIVGALERGTPLVEVLGAQVQDSRDESKRLLLEAAGRKEIAMLIPLVFLILPVTVAFAIYPGLLVLQLGF